MISVSHLYFTTAFPEDVTITFLTMNEQGRAVIIMHASCRRVGGVKTERWAQRKNSEWPYLKIFHLTSFLESDSWCFHLLGRQGVSSSAHSVWNKSISPNSNSNSVSPAAGQQLKVMTRSGVTKVWSEVTSLIEVKLFKQHLGIQAHQMWN